jgi:hypothetical protein
VLNLADGSGSFGRVRTARYRTALGYVQAVPGGLLDCINRVVGTLVRVAA